MNWYARTEQLLKRSKVEKLAKSSVAVFGMGGVGSYAVEALARSGIGHLRLVDFDTVNPSNINRQLFALTTTVDKPKVVLAQERVAAINPDCKVDGRGVFINADTVEGLLEPAVDVVVDAIDSVSSKVNLIVAAYEKRLPVVTSMGAGGRTDSSQIRSGDISESTICPLARIIRKRLHRRGVYEGIRCIYSVERAENKLPYNEEDADGPPVHGRARTPIGTISYMPGIFGLKVAEEAIKMLLKNVGE